MPNDNYMASRRIAKNDGIAIMVESPTPGVGGRHREIHTYIPRQDTTMQPREALAQSIQLARRIYSEDGIYTPEIRSALQDVIIRNKVHFPDLYKKDNLND
ncbi:hypothetical protein ID47_11345 [Candidatus Paracaedibacter acanthamoebae]|uniref:Uncharacterized protein n=1 Tax=Candidatus Odyssella acanthamoebae TaxID=91604 RepID=A0A077AVL6_9PROT|nr:hypothetical protein ID47_11345 [Candidatus Paracaedibacter acanthamoebae]